MIFKLSENRPKAAGVMLIAKDTNRILVAERSEKVNHPLLYNLFGGGIEKGERPLAAALRELKEESGFSESINLKQIHIGRMPNLTYYTFYGYVDKEFEPQLNFESKSAKWISLESLKSLKSKTYFLENLLEEKYDEINELVN